MRRFDKWLNIGLCKVIGMKEKNMFLIWSRAFSFQYINIMFRDGDFKDVQYSALSGFKMDLMG